jgi:hypothetical protein
MTDKCNRCGKEAVYGTCPFAEEINNEIRECNCCEDCRYECRMDI